MSQNWQVLISPAYSACLPIHNKKDGAWIQDGKKKRERGREEENKQADV